MEQGTRTKLEIVLALSLVFVLVTFAVVWHQSSVSSAVAQSVETTQNALIAKSQAEMKQRAIDTKAQVEAILKYRANLTAPQAVRIITETVPSAAPVEVKKEDIAPAVRDKLPDSPSFHLYTDQQVVDIAKEQLSCMADRKLLNACKLDAINLNQQIAGFKEEKDSWKNAAKGSWSSRVVNGGIKIGIGVAVGYGLHEALSRRK